MSLTVACPECSTKLTAPDSAAGRKVKCPKCGVSFPLVPAPSQGEIDSSYEEEEDDLDVVDSRPPRRRKSAPSFMDYVLFRRMIAPTVIQVLFWLAVAGFLVFGTIQFLSAIILLASNQHGSAGTFAALITMCTSLLTIIGGPFVARIYAELLIIFFRIYETLVEIKDNTSKR